MKPLSFMENKNELDESFDEIEESDDTDYKSEAIKLREKAIRQREKTKELREQLKEREGKLAEFEKKVEVKPDEFGLLQKTYLRAAGVVAEDEIELAKSIQKKTGVEWDVLVDDDYFKTKLEALRTAKANADATANIQGSSGAGKNSLEYYLAKGESPVHDKKLHSEYIQARLKQGASGGKKFYND